MLQVRGQSRSQPAQAFLWGFTDLQFDTELLAIGKIGLVTGQGLFPDGTPFSFPGKDAPPAQLDIPKDVKNCVIHLCLPVQRRTGAETTFSQDEHVGVQ